MATIFYGENESPQQFATDALAQATTLNDFSDGVGSSVYSLESGLYFIDNNTADVLTNDLSLDDGTGVLRKSDKQNIFMKDNDDITGLNLPASGNPLPDTEILVGNATNDATAVAMSGDATIANTGALTIANEAVTNAKVQARSLDGRLVTQLTNGNTRGAIPIYFQRDMPGGAGSGSDVTLQDKILLVDVFVVNKGAGTASDTIQVSNGSNAITDQIDISGADETIARASTINLTNGAMDAGATLRVVQIDGGGSDSPPVTVFMTAFRQI